MLELEETTVSAVESLESNIDSTIQEASQFLTTLEGYIPKIEAFFINAILAVIVFLIGRFVIKRVMKVMKHVIERSRIDVGIRRFLLSLLQVGLYILLIVIICGVCGIQSASFVAVIGSGGVAISLAMQGALSNLAGGVTILLVRPFQVGDYILEEMNNGVEGTVQKIDLFYTQLLTVDHKTIMIPNGTLTGSRIINVTSRAKRRVDFSIGISYQADIDHAKEVMWEVIRSNEFILQAEDNRIIVKALEASQVTLEARVWVETEHYWDVMFYLNEHVKKNFDAQGVEIPYNQLDVHLIQDAPNET
jgi:small conductance mechanosensitive channel